MFHWNEARIPVRFRVWTVALGWTSGAVSINDYLTADDAGKDGRIAALIAALPATRLVFDAPIAAMPQIDRDYWRARQLNGFIRKEHFIYERSVKAANDKIESQYQSKLDDWKTKNNVGRVSRRAPVKRHGMPDAPKLAVAASMAKWVQDDAVAKKLHAKLTDATSPPALMSGWTPVERATLTPQHVSNVIFQQ